MLDDDNQAEAYAHVSDALEELNSLLNVLYDSLLEEDITITTSIGEHLGKAKDVLNA